MFITDVVQSCQGLQGLQVRNSTSTNEGKSDRNLTDCGPNERVLRWHLPISGITQDHNWRVGNHPGLLAFSQKEYAFR